MDDGSSRGDPSHPMIKFAGDIGAIKEGVKGLKDGQDKLTSTVSDLHTQMVTKDDCSDHREVLCKKLDAKADANAARAANAARVEADKAQNWLVRWGKKAGAITAIIGLILLCGGTLLALSRFIASVESTLAQDRKVQASQTRQVMRELKRPRDPVIVTQPILVYPDAGVRRYRPRRRYPTRAAGAKRPRRTP